MSLGETSELAIVVAAVGYLVAFACHALEWAFARGLAPARPEDGSEDAARIRVDMYGRFGIAITVVTMLVNAVGVVSRGVAAGRAPWGNMYEFITSAVLVIVAAYLIAVWQFSARWLGLGVTLLATVALGLAVTVFYVDVAPLVPALHSAWFIGHIVAAVIAGGGFNVAGIASIFYLLRLRAEDSGEPIEGYLARVPNSTKLDVFAYRINAFSFLLWTFTVAAGAIWAQYAWGRFWNWDPKETWSLVTWIIYAAYLHARSTAGWRGRRAAWIAVIGLISFWFNFIGVNLLFSGLHSYAGI
ncbi:MAG: c-type cytochrome biogenesis protein CcsB [Arachnia sp.]